MVAGGSFPADSALRPRGFLARRKRELRMFPRLGRADAGSERDRVLSKPVTYFWRHLNMPSRNT